MNEHKIFLERNSNESEEDYKARCEKYRNIIDDNNDLVQAINKGTEIFCKQMADKYLKPKQPTK